jgi:hypothetical protein
MLERDFLAHVTASQEVADAYSRAFVKPRPHLSIRCGANRIPLLETLKSNIECLMGILVAAGRLCWPAILFSQQKSSSAVALTRFAQRQRPATAVEISPNNLPKSVVLSHYKDGDVGVGVGALPEHGQNLSV